jgi:HEAT repeat protein
MKDYGGRRFVRGWLALVGVLLLAGPAGAQISSKQIRDRYQRETKGGTKLEDFVKKLDSPDPEVRLEGVKALGDTKETKAITYLIQALGDPDVRVKAKAIDLLAGLRADDATPVLVQYLFLRSTDPHLKGRIVAALGKIGDTRAVKPLIEFLQRDLDPDVRGTAIFALGEIGSPEALDSLEQVAKADSDPTLRRVASEAVAKVQAHQAVLQSEAKQPPATFLDPKRGPQPGPPQ